MPRIADIKKVLVLGSGPIVIGQACEFDYSGVQACLTLKEDGCRVILVNSNSATIMTDSDIADATYIEPINWMTVEKIIEKERPDSLLPIVGGQTALNCTIDLVQNGVLEKFGVKIIGSSYETIMRAENREYFKRVVEKAGLETPNSIVIRAAEEYRRAVGDLQYPLIVRASFTLGGCGSGIVYNDIGLLKLCEKSFELSPGFGVLVEESVLGWKEFELETMCDSKGNYIVVCSIENLDPMGIHTGDSIVVAPAQTLTDKEYQRMRRAAFKAMGAVGMTTGGCNVQFAVNPTNGRMLVIEINPRVSRSSALASKATGFPIAKVATKIALGYTLDEIRNAVAGYSIPASFEPSLDYVVVKMPRFNFEKFSGCNTTLTTHMKSVGEVMAIGGSFQEALQKAIYSLENGLMGLDSVITFDEWVNHDYVRKALEKELSDPSAKRLQFIADAFRFGFATREIAALTSIDPWFLDQIQELVAYEFEIKERGIKGLDKDFLLQLKEMGFSDCRIAKLCRVSENTIRVLRKNLNIIPVYKRINTCAAEFLSPTVYLYSTYASECEASPTTMEKVIVIGSGPNRIGQGLEFDYCCVHVVKALREFGYETIMVNCNPETVSTDYDISDRLYFEPLILEKILDIIDVENPLGVSVQFGGQTPLNLALPLENAGVPLIGTSYEIIDLAENRKRFKDLLDKIWLKQPENGTFTTSQEAFAMANQIQYPLVLRPSYVLGGRAIALIANENELKEYLSNNQHNGFPVLMEKFLENATEVEVDAIRDSEGSVLICGIMEQLEPAGVHSGDSSCHMPVAYLGAHIKEELRLQSYLLARELNICGFVNIQFAVSGNDIYVIEVNPRASRTIPFISKATGVSVVKLATGCVMGKTLREQQVEMTECKPLLYSVKMPVFPFSRLPGSKTELGMEMKSTGEVMGFGSTLHEAYLKAKIAAFEKTSDAELKPQEACPVVCLQELYGL